ncbi:hypothetical protein BH23BAC3_BH23BAC3_15050 [soil metagenome]
MKRLTIIGLMMVFLFGTAFVLFHSENEKTEVSEHTITANDWSMNATAIEACTCPMFCQCYFNTEPAAHGHDHDGDEAHYCKFNMAWKINNGHHGDTDLTDALFWVAGDLGSGWEDGNVEWAALHFDPSVSEAQREGITTILSPLFPANWRSFTIGDDMPIQWQANNAEAVATLDNGNAAEVRLIHPPTAMTDEPAILSNVQYWGAPRHDGFIMMPNEVQAYRTGDKAFESSGSNGFMITVDINSADI